MAVYFNSRRQFLQLMGITSILIVLENWGRQSLAQNPLAQNSFQPLLHVEAWIARHGISADEYQSEFNKYTSQGYRPVVVSGYTVNNQVRYAAIFAKVPNSPAWIARHGLTGNEYQSEFNKYVAQGYRPVQVSVYVVNNQAYYAAIFEQTQNAPAWVARHGINATEYQREFDKYVGQGYRLIDISVYVVNNQDYYAAIFEQTSTPAWVVRHGMTNAEYQSEYAKYAGQGYRLVRVCGYELNGQDRYAAIWEKSSGGDWPTHHGMTSQSYQDKFNDYDKRGYRLVWVNGYSINGQDRYAAIWSSWAGSIDQIVNQFMKDYNVPGLSFAIVKNESSLLTGAYGYADQSTGEKVTPQHRFRIASLSKPITAIAIMQLIEQGKLKLSDRVFGKNGTLGTLYGTPPYKPDSENKLSIENITVEHLLTHLAGGWGKDANDPMFSHPEKNQAELISWTLDHTPLEFEPGTKYLYSNFGYCLLGRVIEKVTGQTYENYVKNNILSQCGITDMEIGGDTLAEKKANEVTYYGQGGENPYGMKVARMDSHGGWIAKPIDLMQLLMRVDGLNTKPDLLSVTTLNTMYTPSNIEPTYAKGWNVNSLNNHWHIGSLPGEQAVMVNTSDGFSWAVLINTRLPNSDIAGKLDDLMWNVKKTIIT
jgi:CubicO group peptidase (beta-lactamase class C family)